VVIGEVSAAQRYELTAQVGHGPNGTVWRAHDLASGETVAVKVLHQHLVNERVIDRFQRERPVLTAHLHPAYVRVRDLVADRSVGLVMELVGGLDLRYYLGTGGPLRPPAAAEIAAIVAEALAAAHSVNVVHGDLKPSNILLENDTGQVRLTDLRVAWLARGVAGPANPEYAAPEVVAGGPAVPATDVYALALVLVELLTGAVPVAAAQAGMLPNALSRPDARVPARLPALLRPLLAECLRPEPEVRPTAAQMATELRAVLPALLLVVPDDPAAAPVAWPPDVAWPPTVAWPRGAGWLRNARLVWARFTDQERVPRRPPAGRRSPWTAGRRTPPPAGPQRPARWVGTRRAGRPRHAAPSPLRRYPALACAATTVLVAGAAVALVTVPRAGDHHGDATGHDGRAQPSPGAGAPGAVSGDNTPHPPVSSDPPTVEGATLFVNYWFEALNYATRTGRTTPLEWVSSPDCVECQAVVEQIRDTGPAADASGYTMREVRSDRFWTESRAALFVVYDRGPRRTAPGAPFLSCQVVLERAGDRWRMRRLLSDPADQPTPFQHADLR
jgi:hypothetical protein